MIYLITVNYNAAGLIAQLLQSIQAAEREPITWTLLIVNNSPADSAIAALQSDQVQIFEAKTNLGFGAACNLALNWVFERNPAAIVWLINPDTRLTADALLQAATMFTTHPDCSILGTLVTEPTGKLWFGGGKFNAKTGEIAAINLFADRNSPDYLPCDWVTGCSLLLNLSRFPTCPQFDPRYFLYYEDFDFCQRYHHQGHQVGITRRIQVIHQPSSIADRNPTTKFKYSTQSYLLTLARYTSRLTLAWRFGRLLLHALLLLFTQPQVAIGKFQGVLLFLSQVDDRGRSTLS